MGEDYYTCGECGQRTKVVAGKTWYCTACDKRNTAAILEETGAAYLAWHLKYYFDHKIEGGPLERMCDRVLSHSNLDPNMKPEDVRRVLSHLEVKVEEKPSDKMPSECCVPFCDNVGVYWIERRNAGGWICDECSPRDEPKPIATVLREANAKEGDRFMGFMGREGATFVLYYDAVAKRHCLVWVEQDRVIMDWFWFMVIPNLRKIDDDPAVRFVKMWKECVKGIPPESSLASKIIEMDRLADEIMKDKK